MTETESFQDILDVDSRVCLLSLQSALSIAQLILTALFTDQFPGDDEKFKVFYKAIPF
jgi:hypothetical protein